jgi:hypothetical protein
MATALVGAEIGSFFHNVVNESRLLYAQSGAPPEDIPGFRRRNTAICSDPHFAAKASCVVK